MVSRLDTLRSLTDFSLNLKGIGAVQQLCVLRRTSFVHQRGHLNTKKIPSGCCCLVLLSSYENTLDNYA